MTQGKEKPRAVMARAIADAEREKDGAVAKRYGINVTTLRRWRKRAGDDLELAGLVDQARRHALSQWRAEAASTFIAICAEVRRRVMAGDGLTVELIAGTKAFGAVCVEAGALLGEPDPNEDPWGSPASAADGDRPEPH